MSSPKEQKYRLLAPGPVQVSEQALQAMSEPMIHHRTPEFSEVLKRTLKNLPQYFLTSQPVLMVPSTGSGGMEAAVVNCFSPGDQVLSIVSGKFGERWADLAEAFGVEVTRLNVPWGEAVDMKEFETALADKKYRGVMTQACETSTATLHPIKEIAKLTRDEETLLLVDGITAVGCTYLPMDAWGVDVLVAGSQKALSLPTGLAFVALSDKAWKANEKAKCARFYFDLRAELEANKKNQTRFSSLVSHIRALDIQLQDSIEHGVDHLVRRSTHLATSLRKAAESYGMCCFSLSPSSSLTALVPPKGVDGGKLRSHLEEKYNITVMGGQEQLKGKIIRIGHMGDISNSDQLALVQYLGLSLKDLGAQNINDKLIEDVMTAAEAHLKMGSNV